MKKLFYTIFLATSALLSAQTATKESLISDLPELEITDGINLHIISPEPVQFVDLSTDNLVGDLPSENIARVKISDADSKLDSKKINKKNFYVGQNLGVITVVGQSFMAQYKAVYRNSDNLNTVTNIHIQPEDMQPIEFPKMTLSNMELHRFALNLLSKKIDEKPIRKEENLKLEMDLNNVYVMNDYIFLDITFKNKSNLSYDIDQLKFSIEDKKIHKATNNQSIEIKPIYKSNYQKFFRKNYRNIYVFKKFTYPNSKVLMIRLVEEQISGRTVEMKINYSDILKADTF